MKTLKRILLALAILVGLLIVALIAAPILFKDQIVEQVRIAANDNVNAEVDFTDIDVSFLRSFPDINVTIEDVSVIGVDTFARLPLLKAKEVAVDLGFWSVIGGDGNYVVDAVALEQPDINLLVLSPELANYLIALDSGSEPGSSPTDSVPASAQISLNHFEVNNGSFVYDDRTTDTYIKITGLTTTGDGDFTSSIFDLDTYSEMDELTLSQAGVKYLNKVKATADAIVNIDSDELRYTFKENAVKLNALQLTFDGSIDLEDNDDIVFDLTYQAPANDFRQLWSMIPATYTQGFDQVKTSGSFTLNGTVKGPFNSVREVYPAFTLSTSVGGGSVQYPGRPIGITGIDADIKVNSPSSNLDQLKVDIPRFNFNLGGDPFAGSFRLATPLSDPNVDARLDGTIDLDKWASAIPLEGVRELGGKIIADIALQNVRQSLIDAGSYADMNMTGTVGIADLVYVADDLPPVKVPTATAEFTPRAINVENFSAQLGRSDMAGSAHITTPLAYFSPEQTIRGDVTLRSNFFDADEWVTEEAAVHDSPAELAASDADPAAATEVFDRFDFDIDATIKELRYGEYRPKNLRTVGNIKPNRLEIGTAEATLGESAFTATGTVTNLFNYTFDEGVLGGDLTVRSPYINMADFMSDAETRPAPASGTDGATAPSTAAIPVPNNINLTVNLNADRVKYDDIDLTDMRGQLLVQAGQAVIQDGTTNLFGGRMKFAGAYDTTEPDDPGFRFHYDMEEIDFSSAFSKLNTFAALAPVGKYIRGKFNSDLVLEGKLGEDLFPKLSSIDAKGLFKTFEAQIVGLEPVQKIGQALKVKELNQSTTLKNIIAAFTVEDGTVAVEPFDFSIAGIDMNMRGRHSLTQEMDYVVRAAIPRSMIAGNFAGGAALSAIDALAGQAGKLGINIQPGDVINVQIGLTGSLGNTKTNFKLLGADGGEVADPQDAIVDAVRDRAQQELAKQEDKVREEAQQRIDALKETADERRQVVQDSIRRAADAEAARLRREAERALASRLDSLKADSLRNLLPDALGDPADRVKEELERFNPFKKKKKKDN